MKTVKKIALGKDLSNVEQELRDKEIEVVALEKIRGDRNKMDEMDAIILSGEEENLLGIEKTETKTMILCADGKSAKEVYKELIARTANL